MLSIENQSATNRLRTHAATKTTKSAAHSAATPLNVIRRRIRTREIVSSQRLARDAADRPHSGHRCGEARRVYPYSRERSIDLNWNAQSDQPDACSADGANEVNHTKQSTSKHRGRGERVAR